MKLVTDASIIAFDDADLSIYAIVFPIFKTYNIKATFFIISDFVGTVGYVNRSQLKEMSEYRDARGEKLFTIGSHSLDHMPFDQIPESQIPYELAGSKSPIERNIKTILDILQNIKHVWEKGFRNSTLLFIQYSIP